MEGKRIVMIVLMIVAGAVTNAGADLSLPYEGTVYTDDSAFSMTNTNIYSGIGVYGHGTTGLDGEGLMYGSMGAIGGIGVEGYG